VVTFKRVVLAGQRPALHDLTYLTSFRQHSYCANRFVVSAIRTTPSRGEIPVGRPREIGDRLVKPPPGSHLVGRELPSVASRWPVSSSTPLRRPPGGWNGAEGRSGAAEGFTRHVRSSAVRLFGSRPAGQRLGEVGDRCRDIQSAVEAVDLGFLRF